MFGKRELVNMVIMRRGSANCICINISFTVYIYLIWCSSIYYLLILRHIIRSHSHLTPVYIQRPDRDESHYKKPFLVNWCLGTHIQSVINSLQSSMSQLGSLVTSYHLSWRGHAGGSSQINLANMIIIWATAILFIMLCILAFIVFWTDFWSSPIASWEL